MDHDELADFNQTDWQTRLDRYLIALGMAGVEPTSAITSAPWKLAIASRLKRECSVTNAWLTASLAMGGPKAVSAQVGRYRRDHEASCKLAARLRKLNIDTFSCCLAYAKSKDKCPHSRKLINITYDV